MPYSQLLYPCILHLYKCIDESIKRSGEVPKYRIEEKKTADNYFDNFSSFCIDLIVLPRVLLLCNDWRDVFCCSCKATLLVIITQPYLSTLWLFALIEEKPRSPTFSCNFCNRRLSRKLNALVPAAAKLISELWLRIFVIGQGGGGAGSRPQSFISFAYI